ncbi:phage holin family protein [Patescibacteria group bacterium]|nr:phage holin family protein [Patescibacteria group bacterium]
MKIKILLLHIGIGILTFYLAILFIPGVSVKGDFQSSLKILFFAGIVLGLVNYFLKPIIDLITAPIRILTFGVFGLIINMSIIWFIDILFSQLIMTGITPLFYTGILICFLNFFASKIK